MVYRQDDSAVRDANDELDDQEYQSKVNAIQKQIDSLQETMEDLTDDIDDQIDKLQEYADKWSDVANAFQDMQNAMIATAVLGDDWQNKILNMDPTLLDNFKNNYISAQQSMADMTVEATLRAAQAAAKGAASITASVGEVTEALGGDQSTSGLYVPHNADGKTTGTEKSTSSGAIGALENFSSEMDNTATNSNNAADGMENFANGIDNALPSMETGLELMKALAFTAALFASLMNGIDISSVAKSINDTISGYTIIEDSESKKSSSKNKSAFNGTVGNAFASGTGYKGLKGDTPNALRSEYGQPELTVYPNGTYELTTEPTIDNLPKDTVIFNEHQTKKILHGGKAFAEGTGAKFTPLSNTEKANYNKISSMLIGVNSIDLGVNELVKSINKLNEQLTPSANLPAQISQAPTYTFGDIQVICPGVTSEEVTKNLPSALETAFKGLSLNAYQQSMRR